MTEGRCLEIGDRSLVVRDLPFDLRRSIRNFCTVIPLQSGSTNWYCERRKDRVSSRSGRGLGGAERFSTRARCRRSDGKTFTSRERGARPEGGPVQGGGRGRLARRGDADAL